MILKKGDVYKEKRGEYWFRDNGEKHIGLTIEELIEEYLR